MATVSLESNGRRPRSPERARSPCARPARGAQLTLLNGFGLACGGASVRLSMNAQRLIAFVALHRRPLLRPYVAGSLWSDTSDDRAHASLRSALWRLHRSGFDVVEAVGPHLRLACDVRVDFHEAEATARMALGSSGTDGLDVDRSTLVSDVLPDWYEDWVLIERERFRQLRLRTLDALCERLTRAGRLDEALETGLCAVAGEPLRESAHRALVRVHLAEGNAVEAIRQYWLCRRLLRDRLGVEPSERMKSLIRELDDSEATCGDAPVTRAV